ncbi:uncharacterized protein AMSG_03984 [Thecamonas trahens ATCC 50062]|uniref:Uncharacterized protein n=1 Tax=Thecamonas trahens ATCC 50062 TaxID=461836 RepID=A0A0L0D5V0_THETB|nr:hypothetical protein AMSG_03984 [Thecamonas trahens ATCC 50062]KNC47757.1 hypothetical protein AMSG_03984 [Thecamonas trahens ATCC 50062]|eukprot:XP_013759235.1 hypothetical protein AMSG_03984 [Thecamonas trahens ATCC 50062]
MWIFVAPPPPPSSPSPPGHAPYRSIIRKPSNSSSAIPALWLHPAPRAGLRVAARGSWVFDQAAVVDSPATVTLLPGAWHALALVVEYGAQADTARVYINGSLAFSASWPAQPLAPQHSFVTNTGDWFIGCDPWSKSGFAGAVEGVVVRDVPLPAPQIAALAHKNNELVLSPIFVQVFDAASSRRDAKVVSWQASRGEGEASSASEHWALAYARSDYARIALDGDPQSSLVPHPMLTALRHVPASRICASLALDMQMGAADALLTQAWQAMWGLCMPTQPSAAFKLLETAVSELNDARAALLLGAHHAAGGRNVSAQAYFDLATMLGLPQGAVASVDGGRDRPVEAWRALADEGLAATAAWSAPPSLAMVPAIATEAALLARPLVPVGDDADLPLPRFFETEVQSWVRQLLPGESADMASARARVATALSSLVHGDHAHAQSIFGREMQRAAAPRRVAAIAAMFQGVMAQHGLGETKSLPRSLVHYQKALSELATINGGASAAGDAGAWYVRLHWATALCEVGQIVEAAKLLAVNARDTHATPIDGDELLATAWLALRDAAGARGATLDASVIPSYSSLLDTLVDAGSPVGQAGRGYQLIERTVVTPPPHAPPLPRQQLESMEYSARSLLVAAAGRAPNHVQALGLAWFAARAGASDAALTLYSIAAWSGSRVAARNALVVIDDLFRTRDGSDPALARLRARFVHILADWSSPDPYAGLELGLAAEAQGDLQGALRCYLIAAQAPTSDDEQLPQQEAGPIAYAAFAAARLVAGHPNLASSSPHTASELLALALRIDPWHAWLPVGVAKTWMTIAPWLGLPRTWPL